MGFTDTFYLTLSTITYNDCKLPLELSSVKVIRTLKMPALVGFRVNAD